MIGKIACKLTNMCISPPATLSAAESHDSLRRRSTTGEHRGRTETKAVIPPHPYRPRTDTNAGIDIVDIWMDLPPSSGRQALSTD